MVKEMFVSSYGGAEISRGSGVERWSKCLEINGTSSICLYVETTRLVILS